MNLDQLLAGSAPPVIDRTKDLAQELRELTVAAEESARVGRSRRRRYVAASVCALSIVVGGGVAAAAGGLPSWLPWQSSTGTSCELTVTAELRRGADGSLMTDRAEVDEQRAALAAANRYVADLDLDKIDLAEAQSDWFDYLQRVSVKDPGRDALERKFAGSDLETHALIYAVSTRMSNLLATQGYDPNAIMLTVANRCGQ